MTDRETCLKTVRMVAHDKEIVHFTFRLMIYRFLCIMFMLFCILKSPALCQNQLQFGHCNVVNNKTFSPMQCRQARRTRSEVMLLWRNLIPIMIEVMLLPDCCYSDEGPTTDCTDLNDPAIKQDALLLERWTLQPVPRQ